MSSKKQKKETILLERATAPPVEVRVVIFSDGTIRSNGFGRDVLTGELVPVLREAKRIGEALRIKKQMRLHEE